MTPPAAPVVLQILPALNDGGVERGTIEMALYLQAQGLQPMVASSGGRRVVDLSSAGIAHVRLPLARKNPLSIMLNIFRLVRLGRRYGVRLIHARSRAPAWSGYFAAKILGVPFITTFHGTHGLRGLGKKFYNSVMVRGRAVIANSGFVADHIASHYGVAREKIVIAARGADLSVFRPDLLSNAQQKSLRASMGVPPHAPIILLVGRITRWKGQDVLVQALASPALLATGAVVVFAGAPEGKGDYALEVRKLTQDLGVVEQVKFLGARSDVAALYNLAAVAVSASTRPEAFGRVAVEAMACGTPIVATGHGGSLETVVDGVTGILVAPNDAATLAAALVDILEDGGRRTAMGHAGVKHVRAHFSVESMCAQEFSVYKNLLGLP